VRFEIVDHLPNGRLVARAEAPHETVFLVDEAGAVKDFPRFLEQIEGCCQEAVASQAWARNFLFPPDCIIGSMSEG
jgi:hypothetical protein